MEAPRRPGYSLTVDKIAKSSLARDPTREIVYRVTAGGIGLRDMITPRLLRG